MKNLKQTTLMFCALILCGNSIFCQATNPELSVEYKAWITSMDGWQKQKGFLAELKDSSIVFGTQQNLEDIAVTNLQQLKFRKKNAIGKSMGYGALIGFGVGALVGLASGDDDGGAISLRAEDKALLFGILFTAPGAIIGALVGSAKVKIPINGKMDVYQRQKDRLKKYSLMD